MTRLSNERTIVQIEAIAQSVRPSLETMTWTGFDTIFSREHHRFTGQTYAFSIETIDIRLMRRGRVNWHILLIAERWHGTDGNEQDWRTSKWLKVLDGKPADVVEWIRAHNPLWDQGKDLDRADAEQ